MRPHHQAVETGRREGEEKKEKPARPAVTPGRRGKEEKSRSRPCLKRAPVARVPGQASGRKGKKGSTLSYGLAEKKMPLRSGRIEEQEGRLDLLPGLGRGKKKKEKKRSASGSYFC